MTNTNTKANAYFWETFLKKDAEDKLILEVSLTFVDTLKQELFILELYLSDNHYNRMVLAPMIAIGIKKALLNSTKHLNELTREEAVQKIKALFVRIKTGEYEIKERKVTPSRENISMPQLIYWLLSHQGLDSSEILALTAETFQEEWVKESHKKSIYLEYSYMDGRAEFVKSVRVLVEHLKGVRRSIRGKKLREQRFAQEIKEIEAIR